MLFNVPQFIEIEDKIVGPLTAKQLGWLAIGAVLTLVFWGIFDTSAFIITAIIIFAIFGALAFYRPYNQPLLSFITSSFRYVLNPKVYVWKRNFDNIRPISRSAQKPKENLIPKKKTIDRKRVEEISKILTTKQ